MCSSTNRQLRCLMIIYLLLTAEISISDASIPVRTASTMPIIQSVISDNLVFVQEGGVFIEPTGFAYTYSTFIYENIHLVIPNQMDIDYHLPHCSDEENMITGSEKKILIDNVLATLKSRVPEYRSPFMTSVKPRNKRELVTLALLTAAGLMSLGISIYNTVQVRSVAQRSQKMMEEINRLSISQAQTTHALKKVIDSFNNLTTVTIPAIEKQINIIHNEISCTSMRTQFFMELNRRLTQDLFVSVTAGVNAAYNGKITPDFLPPAEIRSKILVHDDMKDSIYQSDITLVYQLGKFMLMSVQHQPFAVSGLLILPRLLKEYVGIVLSVNRVPIRRMTDTEPVILKSEDLAVREISAAKIWTPNFDTCIKHTGTYYCPLHEIRAKYSECLSGMLFKRNITSCEFTDARGYPLIKQVSSGLLVSADITQFTAIRIDADGNRRSELKNMTHSNSSNFLTINDGSEIMLNHDIYLLSHDTDDIVMQINQTIVIPDYGVNNMSVPIPDQIPDIDQYTPHYLTQEWSYTNLILIVIVGLTMVYLFQQLHVVKRDLYKLTGYTQNVLFPIQEPLVSLSHMQPLTPHK